MQIGFEVTPDENASIVSLRYLFFLSPIGCKTKELVKITCDNCRLTFCLKHRLETDHECQGRSQMGSKSAVSAAANRAGAAANRAGAAALQRLQSSQNSQQVILEYILGLA